MLKRLVTLVVVFIHISLNSLDAQNLDPYNTYQWKGDVGPWFEWWYYKVIDPLTHHAFFFCYGIVNPWDQNEKNTTSRAFVTFGDFDQHIILNAYSPIRDFHARKDLPFVQIGNSVATETELKGEMRDSGHEIQWNISIEKKFGWNAMDWGLWYPKFFNIYWHPAQMDAEFSGTIIVDGHPYIFEHADGYQDRNWGTEFPKWWFWMASNSFVEDPHSALVAGGGAARTSHGNPLPLAILIALRHQDHVYEFRSSEPDYIFDTDFQMGHWHLEAKNPFYKLVIQAQSPIEKMMDLKFLTPQGTLFHDYETLNGTMSIDLYERSLIPIHWKNIIHLSTPDQAGLELGSETPIF